MTSKTIPVKRARSASKRSDYGLVLSQLSDLCASTEPGESIPSHTALARQFGASEFSVLRALDELRRNGTIIRRQGASTVVADRVEDDGIVPSSSEGTFLSVEPSTQVVGVLGRFAPEISELLVPYIIGQALEHALTPCPTIELTYFDCFRDENYSVSFVDGARSLLAQKVDALCVISPNGQQMDEIMGAAHRTATPLVAITEQQLPQPVRQVYIDHHFDGYQAGNFYLDAGYKELLFIMLGKHDWALQRLAGVRDAFRHAGLSETAVRVHPAQSATDTAWTRREFKQPLQEWVRGQLATGELRGAVIAANDHVAFDVLEVAEELCPGEARPFDLLGFDDKPEASRRGLTTFRPPLFDMGREGARMLRELLPGSELRGTSLHSRLISQIVKRASTGRAAL